MPNRRQILQRAGAGFGSLALTALLADESRAATPTNPLAPREPHFKARAKRVIFLFMPGGPSQVDTFDPKPELTQRNGKPSPKLYLGQKRNLLASPWKFQKYGKSGLEVSELFPHVAACVDQLCVLRGMVADDVNHPGGCLQMNTGERVATRPSLGVVGDIRPRHREPEPARLRRHRPRPAHRRRPPVRRRVPPRGAPGHLRLRPEEPDPQFEERSGDAAAAAPGTRRAAAS